MGAPTWYAVYDNTNSNLVSVGTTVSDALPSNYSSKPIGFVQPDFSAQQWDKASLTFVALAPRKKVLDKLSFWNKFNQAEQKAIFTSPTVMAALLAPRATTALEWFRQINDVDLNDTNTQFYINEFESLGIISAGRASQVIG